MPKPFAWALLAVGIVLLVYGFQASQSVTSGISRVFTGAPTDKAVWMMAAGVIASVAGALGIF
jgi:hypothetical protein